MEPPFDLSGKTALVTGAGRNIGRAIALELAGLGANIVLNARSNAAEAEAVRADAEAKGVNAIVVLGDMLEKATVEALKKAADAAFERVDICISITVNDIVPVHTATIRDMTTHPQYGKPGYVESLIKEVPIGRMTTPRGARLGRRLPVRQTVCRDQRHSPARGRRYLHVRVTAHPGRTCARL